MGESWEHWKLEYEKHYPTTAAEQARKEIWKHAYHHISRHNPAESKFFLDLNQFSDLVMTIQSIVCEIFPAQTDEEYRNGYLSTIEASNMKRSVTLYSGNMKETEQDIDWRERGFVSEVT